MNLNIRALGYYEVAEMSNNSGKPAAMREDENRKNHIDTTDVTFYKPDFSQMVPFKPKVQWTPGEHVAPGIESSLILPTNDSHRNFDLSSKISAFNLCIINSLWYSL